MEVGGDAQYVFWAIRKYLFPENFANFQNRRLVAAKLDTESLLGVWEGKKDGVSVEIQFAENRWEVRHGDEVTKAILTPYPSENGKNITFLSTSKKEAELQRGELKRGSGGELMLNISLAIGEKAGPHKYVDGLVLTKKPKPAGSLRRVITGQPLIALTFNALLNESTLKTLAVLKEKNAKATFFIVGKTVADGKAIAKQILTEGHEIGNLSMTHPPALSRKSDAEFLKELDGCHTALVEATGQLPVLYRPPGGSISAGQIGLLSQGRNYRSVLWSLDPSDWRDRKAPIITDRVLKGAEKGEIILLHSYYETTVLALPGILDGLKEKGLQAASVSTLLAAGEVAAAPSGDKPKTAVAGPRRKLDWLGYVANTI